jgi:hypothetical protein
MRAVEARIAGQGLIITYDLLLFQCDLAMRVRVSGENAIGIDMLKTDDENNLSHPPNVNLALLYISPAGTVPHPEN